jgi:hypothetical protein
MELLGALCCRNGAVGLDRRAHPCVHERGEPSQLFHAVSRQFVGTIVSRDLHQQRRGRSAEAPVCQPAVRVDHVLWRQGSTLWPAFRLGAPGYQDEEANHVQAIGSSLTSELGKSWRASTSPQVITSKRTPANLSSALVDDGGR